MAAPSDALLTLAGHLPKGYGPPHWVRRVVRLAVVGMLTAAAVLSGRMVGQLGQGTRPVRAIAPTGQPVRQQAATTQVAPWPLTESGAGRR
ncbi:MAG: hypothetical protein ABSB58_12030 [Gemmatimonadales bacterium]